MRSTWKVRAVNETESRVSIESAMLNVTLVNNKLGLLFKLSYRGVHPIHPHYPTQQ